MAQWFLWVYGGGAQRWVHLTCAPLTLKPSILVL